jgi:hypothetical protein
MTSLRNELTDEDKQKFLELYRGNLDKDILYFFDGLLDEENA